MRDFSKVAVGDQLFRVYPVFSRENQRTYWITDLEVTEVSDQEIEAVGYVDTLRTFHFFRHSGFNIHGLDFGWLSFHDPTKEEKEEDKKLHDAAKKVER